MHGPSPYASAARVPWFSGRTGIAAIPQECGDIPQPPGYAGIIAVKTEGGSLDRSLLLIVPLSLRTKTGCRDLFVLAGLEPFDLLAGEETPGSALEVLLGQAGVVDTVELGDRVTQEFENTAHDTVTAGMYLDADLLFSLT